MSAGPALLALDTASALCSAAVFADGRVVSQASRPMERGHAEALIPMIAEVMAAAAPACPAGFEDLDGIAVTVGPGGFTGVRIGLSAARAIGLAAERSVLGLTAFEAVAAAQPPCDLPLLVALGSKRADVYAQLFDSEGRSCGGPAALMPDDMAAMVSAATPRPPAVLALAGDGADAVLAPLRAAGLIVQRLRGHDAVEIETLARLAACRWRASPPSADAAPPRPLYLRPPDVTPPSGAGG